MSAMNERSRLLPILNQDDGHQCGNSGGCHGEGGCKSGCDEQSRRQFLEGAVTLAFGTLQLTILNAAASEASAAVPTAGAQAASTSHAATGRPIYGFLVDSEKCIGSGKCLTACRIENDVPEGYSRTWLERYIHFKDGTIQVDNIPETGVSTLPAIDPETVDRAYFVPKLCNHCEDPPCNQVCPVHAAFTSPEGITLVDSQTCIGCAYCVQACPYGTRFINPKTGTADKCTWCYHRIKRDEQPACVEACPVGARLFGRVDDPDSEISQRIKQIPTHVLKESMGTHPKTRYVGLSQEVI
ncbi:MAG: 4Fe-4S dicluster domain-containing protein [Planctomycetaceae bacterium]